MNPYAELETRIASASSLEEITSVLDTLLSDGYAVWVDGSLYNIKQLVDRVRGMKVEIYAREHPPPHFHVLAADIDATLSLKDGSLLEGHLTGRELRLIEWWYRRSRPLLIRTWNETRAFDCPVGPVLADHVE